MVVSHTKVQSSDCAQCIHVERWSWCRFSLNKEVYLSLVWTKNHHNVHEAACHLPLFGECMPLWGGNIDVSMIRVSKWRHFIHLYGYIYKMYIMNLQPKVNWGITLLGVSIKSWHFWIVCQLKTMKLFREIFMNMYGWRSHLSYDTQNLK